MAASSKMDGGTMSSTSPSFLACLARTCLPVSIRSSALAPPDEARQALGTAGARQQAELHFRQAQHGFTVIGHHPAMTGERQLQPAAGQGREWRRSPGSPGLRSRRTRPVRPGTALRHPGRWCRPPAWRCRPRQRRSPSCRRRSLVRPIRSPFPSLGQQSADLVRKGGLQGVHALTGHIHGEDADAVFANIQKKSWHSSFHLQHHGHTQPTAAQAVLSPNPPPRRRSSCRVWGDHARPGGGKGDQRPKSRRAR